MIQKRTTRALIIVPVFCIGVGTLIALAGREVLLGHGADVYETFFGMYIHWIDVLSMTAGFVLFFLAALVARWWQKGDDRAIRKLLRRRGKGNG